MATRSTCDDHRKSTLLGATTAALTVCLLAVAAARTHGQMLVPTFNGDMGLRSGSLAAPGNYVTNLFVWYSANKIKDVSGNTHESGDLNVLTDAIVFQHVSSARFIDANWSAMIAVPFTTLGLEVPVLGTQSRFGISDVYIQPLKLGWHTPAADLSVGYALVLPSGRYVPGNALNNGFGMWSNEISAGGTLYLDRKHKWHVANSSNYLIQSGKQGTDRRAGDVLTFEGGAGREIKGGLGNIGIAYYAQLKMSRDENLNLPSALDGKHRYFGVAPEIDYPIRGLPRPVIVSARYFVEFGNRVATEGGQLVVMLTYAEIKMPGKPATSARP